MGQSHQQVKASPIGQICIDENQINRLRSQQIGGRTHIAGKMTLEFLPVQSVLQGLGPIKIPSD
jgi:hypothetical protein